MQLPVPEECEDNFNYCGGDVSKYPLDLIEQILNNTLELQLSPVAMHRFFTPAQDTETVEETEEVTQEIPVENQLEDLACEARRELVPRYTRAKNVDNKWVYLAQIGNREFQEIEVTICKNPQKKCLNDLDSPHGEDSTLCRQIFSTQKLLSLDSEGNVNVDTFDLPSACVCKTKIKSPFDGFNLRRTFLPFRLSDSSICGFEQNSTEPLTHDRFDRGFEPIEDFDEKKALKNTDLIKAAEAIQPCDESDFCEETNNEVEAYPEVAVKLLLYRHKLFASREYFEKLFGKPCEPVKPEDLKTRLGFDLEERALCDTVDTYIFPKKAKNSQGVWKYIINTDDYRQGISIHRCVKKIHQRPCRYAGSEGINPDATECRQMYSRQSLLAISMDGSVDYDNFAVPSACVCHIVDKAFFLFF